MQGQVFVPYTGIGGFNMNTGASTFSIGGSSGDNPGGGSGVVFNVAWSLPGGITGVSYSGQGLWGYVLVPRNKDSTYVVDDMIEEWLMGTYEHQDAVEVQPSIKYYTPEDISGNIPATVGSIQADINKLVNEYILRLLDREGEFGEFWNYFESCIDVEVLG